MAHSVGTIVGVALRAALVVFVATACGGGGSGSSESPVTFSDPPVGPPAVAAAIGDTAADAIESVKVALAAADGLVTHERAVEGLAALLGVPVASASGTPAAAPARWAAARSRAVGEGRARILATTTQACTEFLAANCSGTVTTDTDIADNALAIRAGQYVDATFQAVSGYSNGRPVDFTGRLRIEFLAGINLANTSLAGMGLRVKFSAFAGSVAGAPFGPLSETLDLVVSAAGEPSLTVSGARFGTLAHVSTSGPGSYDIELGTARIGFGPAPAAGYASVYLGPWRSGGGRPLVGSSASINGAATGIAVNVTASSAEQVVYTVTIATLAVTRSYSVTASYPAGGGPPSYQVSVIF